MDRTTKIIELIAYAVENGFEYEPIVQRIGSTYITPIDFLKDFNYCKGIEPRLGKIKTKISSTNNIICLNCLGYFKGMVLPDINKELYIDVNFLMYNKIKGKKSFIEVLCESGSYKLVGSDNKFILGMVSKSDSNINLSSENVKVLEVCDFIKLNYFMKSYDEAFDYLLLIFGHLIQKI